MQLYAREEIVEGTQFVAEMEFDTPDALGTFLAAIDPLLNGSSWLRMGKSGMPISVTAIDCDKSGQIAEIEPDIEKDGCQSLTITFLSDAIIRGPYLGFLDKLDAETLCKLAGCPDLEDKISLKGQFETEEISGFNASSALPRISAIAIRRGSQAKVVADTADVDLSALAAKLLELGPVGERVEEGFGTLSLEIPDAKDCIDIRSTKPGRDPKSADQDVVFATAFQLARDLDCPPDGISDELPSSNQFFGFRDALRRSSDVEAFKAVIQSYADHGARRSGAGWAKVKLDHLKTAVEAVPASDFPTVRDRAVLATRLIADAKRAKEQGGAK